SQGRRTWRHASGFDGRARPSARPIGWWWQTRGRRATGASWRRSGTTIPSPSPRPSRSTPRRRRRGSGRAPCRRTPSASSWPGRASGRAEAQPPSRRESPRPVGAGMMTDGEGTEESPGEAGADLIAVGRIVRSQGRRGEVRLEALTDEPERLRDLTECYLVPPPSGERRAVEAVWFQGAAPIVKLGGSEGIGDARDLVGRLVAIPRAAVRP